MSAQWVGYYFDNDDTRIDGSLLLTLLAIADHADSSGLAWPRRSLIAKKARIRVRQVTRNFRTLEDLGYLETKQAQGRGKQSLYQLLRPEVPETARSEKGTPVSSFPEPEIKGVTGDTFSEEIKEVMDDTFSEIKGVTGDQEKASWVTEKGVTHDTPIYNHQEPSIEPSHKPRVRASASEKSSPFGEPLNKPKKIGEHTLAEFRELLDAAAPHLKSEHLEDVRKMWLSGTPPLEVIKCYNVMRMESWRTSRVTWRTVAAYLPDWQFRQEKGIKPGQEQNNGRKKIRTAEDYDAALKQWREERGHLFAGRDRANDELDQPVTTLAGLLAARSEGS